MVPAGQPLDGWVLKFDDEFNGTSLDTSRWATCFPWAAQPDACGTTSAPKTWYLSSNIKEQNGELDITAQRGPYTAPDGHTYGYTSGVVTTCGYHGSSYPRETWQYGYFEARMLLTRGQGLWPNFWALPANGTWPPELDIMEALSKDPSTVYRNYHWGTPKQNYQASVSYTGPDFSASWHTFAASWEPTAIHWYVDGGELGSAFTQSADITNLDMCVLLQLDVGGSWGGDPDSTTPWPSTLKVDYVRVWQRP